MAGYLCPPLRTACCWLCDGSCFLCGSSKPGDSNDKRHHPCHHHHYHQPENPHDHSLKGDHGDGFPRFREKDIFPVAEETSHVDGALSYTGVKLQREAVIRWDHIQHLVKSKCGGEEKISRYKSDLRRVFKLICEVFPNKIWPQSAKETMMMMIILRKMTIKNHLRWR